MLKSAPIWLVCLLAVMSRGDAALAQAPNAPSFKVGVATRTVLPSGDYDWRGAGSHALYEVVWYPADSGAQDKPQLIGAPGQEIFQAAPAATNAKIAPSPGKFPLIMLSHGTGGTAQTLAWFATALAARGYIVAGVNHPGNTALAPYTAQGFLLWWLRAKDISTILDDILLDDEFGPRIDRKRVGAAGFSLGGYTVIELSGGITSRSQFDRYCKTRSDPTSCTAPPEFSDLLAKGQALEASDPAFAKALANDTKSYRDPRIRAAFAMAPALGPAVTAASLVAIKIPVAIVAGEADSVVPVDASAKYYAGKIPHAALTIFPGEVDHYTFVDVCTDLGHSTRPNLCDDRTGVDREAVHAATIDLATKFFAAHLQ
jgi:predicted dienelactone hydrolase